MSDLIQVAIIPIGAFWVCFNSLITAAKFANEMREYIITGYKNDKLLSLTHRRNIYIDWRLTMIGIFISIIIYGIALILLAVLIKNKSNITGAWIPILIVDVVVLFDLIGFLICGYHDRKIIRSILKNYYKHIIELKEINSSIKISSSDSDLLYERAKIYNLLSAHFKSTKMAFIKRNISFHLGQ